MVVMAVASEPGHLVPYIFVGFRISSKHNVWQLAQDCLLSLSSLSQPERPNFSQLSLLVHLHNFFLILKLKWVLFMINEILCYKEKVAMNFFDNQPRKKWDKIQGNRLRAFVMSGFLHMKNIIKTLKKEH